MKLNYVKLTRDYLDLYFKIKRLDAQALKYSHEIRDEIIRTKTSKKPIIFGTKAVQIKEDTTEQTCQELIDKLEDFKKEQKQLIDKIQLKLNIIKAQLKNFKFCFDDILSCCFENFNTNNYTLTSSTVYELTSIKPLDTTIARTYCEKALKNQTHLVTVTVTNSKTNESVEFFKFFDLDEAVENGGCFKDVLFNNCQKVKDGIVYTNSLIINQARIQDIYFDISDFVYNQSCCLNLEAITLKAIKRQENKTENIFEN